MDYPTKFFYEYVNIRIHNGMLKHNAIYEFLTCPHIPPDYKTNPVVQDEYTDSIHLQNETNPKNNKVD
jgi:hypothetical protein